MQRVKVYLHPHHSDGDSFVELVISQTTLTKGDAHLHFATNAQLGVLDMPVILFPQTETLAGKGEGCENLRTPEDWQTSDPHFRQSYDNQDWEAFFDSHWWLMPWINPSRSSRFDVTPFVKHARNLLAR